MGDGKVKVLYIVGCGRSGSTILSNVLDQIDGFFAGGEIFSIWDRNLIQNVLCGCGVPFKDCELWRSVLDKAFGGADRVDVHEMIRLRDGARTRHLPRMLMPGGEQWLISRLGKFRDNLEKLYGAIQMIAGSDVIVDSSKLPSYGYTLGTLSAVDLYVVHLIRDSRGVAHSWQRKKVYIRRRGPWETSFTWNVWNLVTEVFWRAPPQRYLMLRYEDFISKPQEAVARIRNLVKEGAGSGSLMEDHSVELGLSHTASGNPSRFQTGKVSLRLDERWKTQMATRDKVLVTALTWPLLVRYGYILGSSR